MTKGLSVVRRVEELSKTKHRVDTSADSRTTIPCSFCTSPKSTEATILCRKALKLGGPFSCTFNLSQYKILPEIHQVMAPEANSIRAELHKLNIYRAGDFFKAHLDTPRGEDMFGSLVVCLTSAHEGGDLHIRHGGSTSVIDWSTKSGEEIQWVAFYSDCEHEVKEVTSKYRITLTYNLYADPELPAPGRPLDARAVLRALPLYQTLSQALAQQGFMYDGGRLGFMCQHRYPHTSHTFVERPAGYLKGADAVLFAAARAVGLHVRFVHMYKITENNGENVESGDDCSAGEPEDDTAEEDESNGIDNESKEEVNHDDREANDENDPEAWYTMPGRGYWKDNKVPNILKPLRDDGFVLAKGWPEGCEKTVTMPSWSPYAKDARRWRRRPDSLGVASILTPLSGLEYLDHDDGRGCSARNFRNRFISMDSAHQRNIEWCVGETRFWDVGKAMVTYGNEASMGVFYCAAAMLVTVPKWEDRFNQVKT